jgi:DNA-directed RNA polymerase specialized sigma24 family protein
MHQTPTMRALSWTPSSPSVSMEDVYADRALLEQLFQRLRELDPDADRIIELWKENDKISDRSIAEALGRKQRTFADQMKRIRTELRKVRGY